MIVYITPDQEENFTKRFYKMTKHLETIPELKISEAKRIPAYTTTIYNNGWDGISREKKFVNVKEVEIEDIGEGDWIIVASVFYNEGIVTPVNFKKFKEIPEQYGLNYKKCDYCGKMHSNRKDAHILYNTKTDEWMQVGSSCIKKMFASGEYLSTFTVQLYKIVEVCFGCCDPDMVSHWCGSLPDHHLQSAVDIDFEIAAIKSYRNSISNVWEKSHYDGGVKVPGTTVIFDDYYNENKDTFKIDEEYCANVKKFVSNMEDSSEFIHNIKEIFELGFVVKYDIYAVFFATKMYDESLTADDWTKHRDSMPIGQKISLNNLRIVTAQTVDGFYGPSVEVTFEDENKNTYMKNISSMTILDEYKNEDTGLYSFTTKVKYCDDRKRIIILGGRMSKNK